MNALTNLDAALPLVSEPDAPLTGLALCRDRRERAAALWRAVPVRQFDLSTFYHHNECGTVACALGWLAMSRHDGWFYFHDLYPTRSDKSSFSFAQAELYFGLSLSHSRALFGVIGGNMFYGVVDRRRVTPTLVGDALLAAPYSKVVA